ncbi:MAG: hypothetical protein ACREOU_06615 [Candidatus Eiseniibacteriota bacterium]
MSENMSGSKPDSPDLDARLARALGPELHFEAPDDFTESVMRQVLAEADVERVAPSPIAFPWRRAVPAFVLLFVLVGIAFSLLPWDEAGVAADSAVRDLERFADAPALLNAAIAASWLGFGLVLTFVALRVSSWPMTRGVHRPYEVR